MDSLPALRKNNTVIMHMHEENTSYFDKDTDKNRVIEKH